MRIHDVIFASTLSKKFLFILKVYVRQIFFIFRQCEKEEHDFQSSVRIPGSDRSHFLLLFTRIDSSPTYLQQNITLSKILHFHHIIDGIETKPKDVLAIYRHSCNIL